MPLGRGLSGSEVKYILALSPVAVAAAGSTNAFDLTGFEGPVTVGVAANSANLTVNVMRSGTSNGTFAAIGASIQSQASKLVVRNFALNGSPTWYKLSYDNNNAGSITPVLFMAVQQPRQTPINQASTTAVLSNVL